MVGLTCEPQRLNLSLPWPGLLEASQRLSAWTSGVAFHDGYPVAQPGLSEWERGHLAEAPC